MSGSMVTLAKSVKWQDGSKFQIDITGPGASVLDLPAADILSMACQGIQLAEINSNPIEQYVAEEWVH